LLEGYTCRPFLAKVFNPVADRMGVSLQGFSHLRSRPPSGQQPECVPSLALPWRRCTIHTFPHRLHIQLPALQQARNLVHRPRPPRLIVADSYTPDSPNCERVRRMEPLAPPPQKRFAAMEQIACAGILTGTCMMPILPHLCDNDDNLQAVVRWTADHGGRFVLSSTLTLADQQREYFFGVLAERFPDLLERYQALYPPGSYGPVHSNWRPIALRLKELCEQHGISDRIPRPIIPGDKRALNKRVVEALANRLYDMELNGEPGQRVWAYRKAAWAIEDLEQDVGLVYRQMGRKGLESIENVGPRLAEWLRRCSRSGLISPFDKARFRVHNTGAVGAGWLGLRAGDSGYEAFPEARCSALEQGMQAHLRRRRLVIKGRAV